MDADPNPLIKVRSLLMYVKHEISWVLYTTIVQNKGFIKKATLIANLEKNLQLFEPTL